MEQVPWASFGRFRFPSRFIIPFDLAPPPRLWYLLLGNLEPKETIMAIWDALKGQLIDIIQWNDDTRDTMVWRFPRRENEIKNGAKLIVRESQVAAFVNEGQLADVFSPGTHTLETKNLPILSDLMGWKYGFASPFKAEVYFVSTRVFTDRKFGTKNPIMLRHSAFGIVPLRALRKFSIRINDAGTVV